jgi:hypothetical protein
MEIYMTRKIVLRTMMCAALAVAFNAPAFAQQTNTGAKAFASDGDTASKGVPRAFMNKMHAIDTDKDGMVSKAEFLAYATAMFDKMDVDHNGMLTPKEYMAFARAMAADVVGRTHE